MAIPALKSLLNKWLDALELTDTNLTVAVHTDCDGGINDSIFKDKMYDVLTIVIKNKTVTGVKTPNDETIYTLGDDYIEDLEVGWLGKIYDYYTNQLTRDILRYDEEQDSYMWGVLY